MVIDLFGLACQLRHCGISKRELFRSAKLSQKERACVLNGMAISSYAVARICGILGCEQDVLCLSASIKQGLRAEVSTN